MATYNAAQILNSQELGRKIWGLGSSHTNNEIMDCADILNESGWQGKVHITNSSSYKVPNNGEVWPKRTGLGYDASSLYPASQTSNKNIYLVDTSWNSNNNFTDSVGQAVYNDNNNTVASDGYYTWSTGANTFRYYRVVSGIINEIGNYVVKVLSISPTELEVANSSTEAATVSTTYTSSELTVTKKCYVPRITSGTATVGADNTNLSYNLTTSAFSVTADSGYQKSSTSIVVYTITGSSEGQTISVKILVHPIWFIDASGLQFNSVAYDGVNGLSLSALDYNFPSLSYRNKPSWINFSSSTITNSVTMSVSSNSTSVTPRTGTITFYKSVVGTYDGISYSSGEVSDSFTVTQMGRRLWVVVKKSDTSRAYLSRSETSVTSSNLVTAPANITISGIQIQDANDNTSYKEGAISQGSSSGPLRELAQHTTNYQDPAVSILDYGIAQWSSSASPSDYEGYNLQSNIRWIN